MGSGGFRWHIVGIELEVYFLFDVCLFVLKISCLLVEVV